MKTIKLVGMISLHEQESQCLFKCIYKSAEAHTVMATVQPRSYGSLHCHTYSGFDDRQTRRTVY